MVFMFVWHVAALSSWSGLLSQISCAVFSLYWSYRGSLYAEKLIKEYWHIPAAQHTQIRCLRNTDTPQMRSACRRPFKNKHIHLLMEHRLSTKEAHIYQKTGSHSGAIRVKGPTAKSLCRPWDSNWWPSDHTAFPNGQAAHSFTLQGVYVCRRCVYLHDEEKEQDDKDIEMRVQPCSRLAQARGCRGVPDFGPGEIVKKGIDTFPGHQLVGVDGVKAGTDNGPGAVICTEAKQHWDNYEEM